MTDQSDAARGREIVERWCVLAEQRLEYLTELFETNRWRRFFTEVALLENIREAKSAVATWQMLRTQEATPNNQPIDLSWLGRRSTLPPRRDSMLRHEPRPRSLSFAIRPKEAPPTAPLDRESAPQPELAAVAEAPQWPSVDLGGMKQRYPDLYNAL